MWGVIREGCVLAVCGVVLKSCSVLCAVSRAWALIRLWAVIVGEGTGNGKPAGGGDNPL